VLVYHSTVRHPERLVARRLQENTLQAADAIDDFMRDRVADMRRFGENPIFRNDTSDVGAELRLFASTGPFYRELLYVGEEGTILAASDSAAVGRPRERQAAPPARSAFRRRLSQCIAERPIERVRLDRFGQEHLNAECLHLSQRAGVGTGTEDEDRDGGGLGGRSEPPERLYSGAARHLDVEHDGVGRRAHRGHPGLHGVVRDTTSTPRARSLVESR